MERIENNTEHESKTKMSKIKEYIKEMIMNSTVHALPNIYKKERTVFKIMWLLLLLTSIGTNLRLTVKCFSDYLLYETITQIRVCTEQPGNYFNFYVITSNNK
jgi:hypothetical protein